MRNWLISLSAFFMLIWSATGYSADPPGISVDNLIKVSISSRKTNKKTGITVAKATLRNRSKPKQPVYGPLTLVLTSVYPSNITLANATGFTTTGQPYLTIQPPNTQLDARKAIKRIVLQFNNPERKKKVKASYSVYGLLSPNNPPTAKTNPDVAAFVDQEVVMDGSGSTDPDSNPLTYSWTLVEKPAPSSLSLQDAHTPIQKFTVDAVGTYRLQLVVNDGIVDSLPVFVTIQVTDFPKSPGPVNLGELQVVPSLIPTGSQTPVTVSLKILDAEYLPGSAVLDRLDNEGNPIGRLGALHDDGQQGDQTAGDSIFTLQLPVNEAAETAIPIRASAAFRDMEHISDSIPALITVKPNVAGAGPRAFVGADAIEFRDVNGQITSTIPLTHTQETAIVDSTTTTNTITEERTVVSKDNRYVGISKTQTQNQIVEGLDTDSQALLAQEFRYVSAAGTLWSKIPEGAGKSFYIPEYSSILSEDGQRILLIEVDDDATEPRVSVYNASGISVFQESVALSAVTEARLSSNGKYVLLRGIPTVSSADLQALLIIEIDNPVHRIAETFSGSTTTSENYLENSAGGFEVWLNEVKFLSFPN